MSRHPVVAHFFGVAHAEDPPAPMPHLLGDVLELLLEFVGSDGAVSAAPAPGGVTGDGVDVGKFAAFVCAKRGVTHLGCLGLVVSAGEGGRGLTEELLLARHVHAKKQVRWGG